MRRLRISTLLSVLLAIVVFTIKNRQPSTQRMGKGLIVNKSWLTNNSRPLIPTKDVRPPDQTFLTYPEWFLVFSPAEQADYFKTHTSTSFPYMKHIDQVWGGYSVIYDQIKGNFPFNTGYHVMIWVIAGSTTIEYAIKSFYETIIGRLTDTSPGADMAAEDKFNADYEYSYLKFIEDLPWYEYNFNHQLKVLWGDVPFSGKHLLRGLERRYYLTTELLIKSAYGKLIKMATKSAYGTAALNTTVVTDKLPMDLTALDSNAGGKPLPNGNIQLNMPRYARFVQAATAVAMRKVNFVEIAGNRGAIMLTVLTNKPVPTQANIQVLFKQPLFTKPGTNRVALVTTVAHLSEVIAQLHEDQIPIEHIYDY